jgi:hypothetical protein
MTAPFMASIHFVRTKRAAGVHLGLSAASDNTARHAGPALRQEKKLFYLDGGFTGVNGA